MSSPALRVALAAALTRTSLLWWVASSAAAFAVSLTTGGQRSAATLVVLAQCFAFGVSWSRYASVGWPALLSSGVDPRLVQLQLVGTHVVAAAVVCAADTGLIEIGRVIASRPLVDVGVLVFSALVQSVAGIAAVVIFAPRPTPRGGIGAAGLVCLFDLIVRARGLPGHDLVSTVWPLAAARVLVPLDAAAPAPPVWLAAAVWGAAVVACVALTARLPGPPARSTQAPRSWTTSGAPGLRVPIVVVVVLGAGAPLLAEKGLPASVGPALYVQRWQRSDPRSVVVDFAAAARAQDAHRLAGLTENADGVALAAEYRGLFTRAYHVTEAELHDLGHAEVLIISQLGIVHACLVKSVDRWRLARLGSTC